MDFKKLGKTLLFPHIAIMIILVPVSAVCVIYSMIFIGSNTIPSYISYALATYTLTVWCFRIPNIVRFVKNFKKENKYAKIWFGDARLRIIVTLYGSLIWNTAYAVFQLGLGFWHKSLWYFSMAAYYISLAIMRFFLVNHTKKHEPGEEMREELIRYRRCGWIFLVMNLALTVIIFYIVSQNRTVKHHEITTIAMATYTFVTFTMGIVNLVKYRKYNSPVFSASKIISLATACVSMLTLASSMISTFEKGELTSTGSRIMLGLCGGAVSAFVIIAALFMIISGSRRLKQLGSSKTT